MRTALGAPRDRCGHAVTQPTPPHPRSHQRDRRLTTKEGRRHSITPRVHPPTDSNDRTMDGRGSRPSFPAAAGGGWTKAHRTATVGPRGAPPLPLCDDRIRAEHSQSTSTRTAQHSTAGTREPIGPSTIGRAPAAAPPLPPLLLPPPTTRHHPPPPPTSQRPSASAQRSRGGMRRPTRALLRQTQRGPSRATGTRHAQHLRPGTAHPPKRHMTPPHPPHHTTPHTANSTTRALSHPTLLNHTQPHHTQPIPAAKQRRRRRRRRKREGRRERREEEEGRERGGEGRGRRRRRGREGEGRRTA